MKYREKLGYIALGGFLMLVGMLAAGLSSPIGAFNNPPDAVFGTITCEKVRVLDSEGNYSVSINSEEHGGSVGVYGEKGVAIMTIDKTGGRINVAGHKGDARMSIGGHGGFVAVNDKNPSIDRGALMGVDKNNGFVMLNGKDGQIWLSD